MYVRLYKYICFFHCINQYVYIEILPWYQHGEAPKSTSIQILKGCKYSLPIVYVGLLRTKPNEGGDITEMNADGTSFMFCNVALMNRLVILSQQMRHKGNGNYILSSSQTLASVCFV